MITTVDISMYPFCEDFKGPILGFIKRIQNYHDLKVMPSATSTVVQGDFHHVMQSIQETIVSCQEEFKMAVYVLKIIPGYGAIQEI